MPLSRTQVPIPTVPLPHLVDSLPQDVLVLLLGDVFLLVVWFDGQFHLFHCPFLCVQLLQILVG